MRRSRGEHPLPGAVAGLLVLLAGVVFLLDQLEIADAGEVLWWWPAGLVAIGLAYLAARSYWAAAGWIGVGAVLLLPRVGLPGIELGTVLDLWPLTIAFAGGVLIAQAVRPAPKDALGEAGPSFRALAFMAGNVRTLASRDFVGGDAIAVMGGCEIDLSRATMRADEAIIDVLAFWGGVEIRVPRSWTVVGRVAPLLGAFEDKTEPAPEGSPRLIIRGSAVMGGVEVSNR